MHKGFLKTAALLGALSVALGAFAAHSLRQSLSEHALTIFQTGVRYQFYHVFALLAAGMLFGKFPNRAIRWGGYCFIAGTVLFSFSLYILSIVTALEIPGYNWVGAITPVGGLFFMAGWILLFAGILKKN